MPFSLAQVAFKGRPEFKETSDNCTVIAFHKYQGAGNDFVMVDDRQGLFPVQNTSLVKAMCDRHFGIGADGLILLRSAPVEGAPTSAEDVDFYMHYYNSDGQPSSMCGNGGRCLVAFARQLGLIQHRCSFMAIDGWHEAIVHGPEDVELKMIDVDRIERIGPDAFLLDTGSPHYVSFVDRLDQLDIIAEARAIRYSDRFRADGVNVNFVRVADGHLDIRTYERGVEDETLACGTGVTAAALVAVYDGRVKAPVKVHAVGGDLEVRCQYHSDGSAAFVEVWKRGPAKCVFQGHYLG